MPKETLQMTIDYINNYIINAGLVKKVGTSCRDPDVLAREFPYFLEALQKSKGNNSGNVAVEATETALKDCVESMLCNQREKLLLECPSVEAVQEVMKAGYKPRWFSDLKMGDLPDQQVLLGSYYFYLGGFFSAVEHWRRSEKQLKRIHEDMRAYNLSFYEKPAQETVDYYQRLLTIVEVCLPLAEQKLQEETIEKQDIPRERTAAGKWKWFLWNRHAGQATGDAEQRPLLDPPSIASTYGSICPR